MFSPGSKTSNSNKESNFGRLGGKGFGSLTSIKGSSQKAGSIRDEKLQKHDKIVSAIDVSAIKSKPNRQVAGSNFLSPQHQQNKASHFESSITERVLQPRKSYQTTDVTYPTLMSGANINIVSPKDKPDNQFFSSQSRQFQSPDSINNHGLKESNVTLHDMKSRLEKEPRRSHQVARKSFDKDAKVDELLERVCLMGMENDRLSNKVSELTSKLSQNEGLLMSLRNQVEISHVNIKSNQNEKDLQGMIVKLANDRDTLMSEVNELRTESVVWKGCGDIESKLFETEKQMKSDRIDKDRQTDKLNEVSNQVRLLVTENERLLIMLKEKDSENMICSSEIDYDIKKLINENSKIENTMREGQRRYDELKLQFDDVENKICTEMSHKVRLLMNENDKLSVIIETKNNDIESWRVRFEEQECTNNNKIDFLTCENNQYRQNNECLEFDLKKCIEQEDILKDTCFDLEKILEERKAETGRLEKDYLDSISNLENLLKEERNNCDKTQSFLSEANNRIHCLSTELQEEHRHCEKLHLTVEEVKCKNNTLSHELNEEIKRFNMTHKALDDANNTISRLSMEHNELISKLDAQTKDNGYLVEELNCLTNDCKNLEIVNGNLTLQIEKFTRQVADLKDENESFKSTIRCNEDLICDQNQQLVQSQNDIHDFEFDCEKLRNALSDSDNVIKDLNYEIERLYIAKTSQEDEMDKCHDKIKELVKDITEKEGVISDYHMKNQSLGNLKEDLNIENDKLNHTIIDLHSDINLLHQEKEERREAFREQLNTMANQEEFKKQRSRARVLVRIINGNLRVVGQAFRSAHQQMLDDLEYEAKITQRLKGCTLRMTNANHRLMSAGYNKLVEASKLRKQYLQKKLKFVIKTLGDKDASSAYKAYSMMKERKLLYDGVGFGDAAMKKINLLKRLTNQGYN